MRSVNAPVVGIDIDGTLGAWHQHFLWFAEMWTGKEMPKSDEQNPGKPLHKHMGLSKQRYREVKLAFRRSGLKRAMPAFDGARELTVYLRKMGAQVWLCTTRPYLQMDNVDTDTRHWLRRNQIQYDGLLWGEHKYRQLVKQVGAHRVVAVLDDLPGMIYQAEDLELMAFVRDQPYNRHMGSLIMRVDDLFEAKFAMSMEVANWYGSKSQSSMDK